MCCCVCVCVCVCTCVFSLAPVLSTYGVRVCKCACVRACVRVCIWACVRARVQQQYDENQQKVRTAHAMRYN